MDTPDFSLLVDLFRHAPRQGPGEAICTRKALRELDVPPGAPLRILDIGCGTGSQTAALVEMTAGTITAVDLLPDFLADLRLRPEIQAAGERVTTLCASMQDLPFAPESFDLIWCEGAAYHLGLEQALALWRPLLTPGGRLALTDLTLSPHPSQEALDYWRAAYPGVGDETGNRAVFERTGFVVHATFPLPERAWEAYYAGLEAAAPAFLKRQAGNPEALALVESNRQEEAFWRLHGAHYGYTFYLAVKE